MLHKTVLGHNVCFRPHVSNIFKMLMYADDTTLYCNIDQNADEDTINNELAKIWEWLIANKLLLKI